ncbi:MAG TPA: hypothetical protein VF545_07120 [Thermoleophilaceae bacterium]|jgi:hypothetical protein
MSAPRGRRRAALAALTAAVVAAVAGGATWSAFSATTTNASSLSGAPDFTAPTVSANTIAKPTGYTPNYIKQGGSYYVYANVADTGNPASGIATVKADVGNVTTGQTALTMTAGTYTAGGVSYNYRSALQTANAGLSAGSKAYTLTTTDVAGNSKLWSGSSVNVDNTAPTIAGADYQTQNKAGGTAGKMETGDTFTLTFGDTMDPDSILGGWTGAPLTVTVRATNNGTSDYVEVYNSAGTTLANLGAAGVANRLSGNVDFTASSMVQAGAAVTVTLGTPTVPSNLSTRGGSALQWSPSTGAYDRAGNPFSTSAGTLVTESGSNDTDF